MLLNAILKKSNHSGDYCLKLFRNKSELKKHINVNDFHSLNPNLFHI